MSDIGIPEDKLGTLPHIRPGPYEESQTVRDTFREMLSELVEYRELLL